MTKPRDVRPLILHVVYRFDIGGLENGVVNLINRLPESSWRHAVMALTDVSPRFSQRVQRTDVRYVLLRKGPGHLARYYPRLIHWFRELAPAIVHTRNLAALEATVPAWVTGVPARIHGEHGRDASDPDGMRRRYQWVRRAYSPFVSRYVALSQDLERYLRDRVGIAAERIVQLYNGVDSVRFRPADGRRQEIKGCPFGRPEHWIVGTVGRLDPVKDQTNLARALVHAVHMNPAVRARLRLIMVGGGSLRADVEHILEQGGVRELAWLAGERNDIPEIMRGLDCFVLPSRAEGISNTILEAMASALPVIATDVGGNSELLEAGESGTLVPAADAPALAAAMLDYLASPGLAQRHGRAGRERVERRFSLEHMVDSYHDLYLAELRARGGGARSVMSLPTTGS